MPEPRTQALGTRLAHACACTCTVPKEALCPPTHVRIDLPTIVDITEQLGVEEGEGIAGALWA